MVEVRSNQHVTYRCAYHVVWCPKYRRSVLINGVAERLGEIIHEVATERGAQVIELEVMPDHVELIVEVDPQYGIHRLIGQMKARSSGPLRQEFPALRRKLPTLWTRSYFVATVGGAPLEVVKQYISDQKNA